MVTTTVSGVLTSYTTTCPLSETERETSSPANHLEASGSTAAYTTSVTSNGIPETDYGGKTADSGADKPSSSSALVPSRATSQDIESTGAQGMTPAPLIASQSPALSNSVGSESSLMEYKSSVVSSPSSGVLSPEAVATTDITPSLQPTISQATGSVIATVSTTSMQTYEGVANRIKTGLLMLLPLISF